MYTFRIEESSAGSIEAYIDFEGKTIYYQPHHPSSEGYAPWNTNEEATSWAIEFVNRLNNQLPAPEKVEIE